MTIVRVTRFVVGASFLLGAPLALAAQPPAQQPSAVQRQLMNAPDGGVPDCPVAAAAAVAELPDDVDLIIVVENASELRATPVGDAVSKFLRDSGIEGLSIAWSALAAKLGWSTSETFDRLLGERVVLVSKGVSAGNDRRWAILSDVSTDTETRLKERLQAAPRAIEQGHQILSLENGEYELTSHHRASKLAPKQPGGGRPSAKTLRSDRVTLVLGPAGKDELFDQIVGIFNRGSVPHPTPAGAGASQMSGTDAFAQACQAGPTEVLVLVALDPAHGDTAGASAVPAKPSDRWKNFALFAARRDENAGENVVDDRLSSTWRSRVVVRQTERREELMKLEATSDASFRALSSDALFAMMQNAPLPTILGQWAPTFTNIFSMIPVANDAKSQMTARQAISIRAIGSDKRVSCTIARQTTDTQQLARTLDPEIASGMHRIEKQFGVNAPPPQNYGGIACNAVRTTPMTGSSEGMLSALTSRPLTVSWAYPSQAAVNGPANLSDPAVRSGVAAAPGVAERRPGWWVLNVCQSEGGVPAGPNVTAAPATDRAEIKADRRVSPGELVRRDANALLVGDPQDGSSRTARWVWLASGRPAALESLLPSVFPDYNGLRSALRRFEMMHLELQITEQGDVQGDLSVRLTPTAK